MGDEDGRSSASHLHIILILIQGRDKEKIRTSERAEADHSQTDRPTDMRSLLKLTVLLLCVQRGAGHLLRSLLELKEESASSHYEVAEDGEGPEVPSEADVGPEEQRGALRSRRSVADTSCSLQSLLIQVRDLGLGYDSDEMVLFKYCAGSCPLLRSNHDLTLANLLRGGLLPAAAPGQSWHSMPCCRPTHHEDMVFLDNAHRWHKVEKLSAAGCACVG